jgi:hypothetical protein
MDKRRRYRDVKDYRLVDTDDASVLRDGEKMRVPMYMADSGDAADAADGHVLLADHQPGHYRPKDQAALDARAAAYRAYDAEQSTAWRTEPIPEPSRTAGALPYAGGQVNDLCTVRNGGSDEGAAGTLQMINGALVCVPDQRSTDAMPRADDHYLMDDRFIEADRAKTTSAYAAYDAEAAEAWRGR